MSRNAAKGGSVAWHPKKRLRRILINDWSQGKQWVLFPWHPLCSLRRSRGNDAHCSLRDQSLSVLLYLPTQKSKKKSAKKSFAWHGGLLKNLPRLQGARPDHAWVKSFPRKLLSFHPRHVKRSPPIGTRIWAGRYNNEYPKRLSTKVQIFTASV